MKQNCFYYNFPPAAAFPLSPLEWTSFGSSNTTVLLGGNDLKMKQNCFYYNFPPAAAFPLSPLEWTSFGRSNTTVLLVRPPQLKTSSYTTVIEEDELDGYHLYIEVATGTSMCLLSKKTYQSLFLSKCYVQNLFCGVIQNI